MMDGCVGVATGDMGIGRTASRTARYTPGVELVARETLFAEGCRGSLTKTLVERFGLRDGLRPADLCDRRQGIVGGRARAPSAPASSSTRSAGRSTTPPMAARSSITSKTARSRSASSSGSIIGTRISARSRSSSASRPIRRSARFFEGGRRIAYGARALNEGGLQSIPKLDFPGGALVGCAAGFVNVPKIKGSHTAMKSGMVAAETVFAAARRRQPAPSCRASAASRAGSGTSCTGCATSARAFAWGLWGGLALFGARHLRAARPRALDLAPPSRLHHADRRPAKRGGSTIPSPTARSRFDRLSSVFISNTNHEEDQPPHLRLRDPAKADRGQLSALRLARAALLSGRRLRDRR